MKLLSRLTLIAIIFFSQTAFNFQRIDYKDARHKNVCKVLHNNVLVFLIFVDSKDTSPWTEFDIQSTIDSLNIAIDWLERKAKDNNVNLNLVSDYYIGQNYTTVKRKLPEKSVYESVFIPSYTQGIKNLNDWADKIAREVGTSLETIKKDGIPEIDKPRNKERLIAYLRDKYAVESVALLYMVNNYFKEDISIPINTMTTNDVEFAIVSYKYPSEITHNILHLFGAADLYDTPLRKNKKKIQLAQTLYPNDIMQDPYARGINSLEIGDFTKYMIGWTEEIDPVNKELLKDNMIIKF
jgi:hypothetical protein